MAKSISCRANDQQDDARNPESKLLGAGRRELLISLGGLYGAVAGINGSAVGAPIEAPDITKCIDSRIPGEANFLNCCPPYSSTIVDFVPPPPPAVLRIRRPAHVLAKNPDYVKKYEKAVQLMRDLPGNDPRNFLQQASVHCAYCDNAYSQVGFPGLDLQVHGSWIFLPFHRLYLYFHERILGKLIGDESFTLPFWNWDSPAGMQIPPMYTKSSSDLANEPPLYNPNRGPKHLPPAIVDLNYNPKSSPLPAKEQIQQNLNTMYTQMISGASKTSLFYGGPYRAGDSDPDSAGTIESVPHNPVHVWVGDPDNKNYEDMGSLYSAARDPIFYAHHSNVDRLWSVWKTLSPSNKDFIEDDWLNASFLFYDENAQLVRVKVSDALDTQKLGYKYEDVDNPWRNSKPIPAKKLPKQKAPAPVREPVFPLNLEKPVRATVKRAKRGRSKKDKDEEEEVLLVQGIEVMKNEFVKFDVYINAEEEEKDVKPSAREFAGSFVHLPHHHQKGKVLKTNLRLGITELLEDLKADDDDIFVVTLVPKTPNGKNVKIGGLRIEFIK